MNKKLKFKLFTRQEKLTNYFDEMLKISNFFYKSENSSNFFGKRPKGLHFIRQNEKCFSIYELQKCFLFFDKNQKWFMFVFYKLLKVIFFR